MGESHSLGLVDSGLRDYRFGQFLDMTVKGEGHGTVGAVAIYVKT
jgi:hypothetical protein